MSLVGNLQPSLLRAVAALALSVGLGCLLTGCSSAAPAGASASSRGASLEPLRGDSNLPEDERTPTLMEGFVVEVAFPGASNLNTTQKLRPDGKITLPLIGEVEVVGLTPVQLKERLEELYKPELVSNEVSVTLVSAEYPVSVNGAVNRAGEIMLDRPTTVFELVMKAGFDIQRANLGKVAVIRRENGEPKRYELNLQLVLDGKDSGLFFLRPGDAVYVPAKFI